MTARFHIQCQNIQIATLIIIITIHSNYLDRLTFLIQLPKNASKSAVFWYCKPFSIHSFLVLLWLPTLEHTSILWWGGLVLRWSKFSAPWGFGGMPLRKCWNLHAQKEVFRLTESNLSQIRAWVKCLSHCLVFFVVQWLGTLIQTLLLTLTQLLTHPNPIRLWILFHFRVCRLTESNSSLSKMSESHFNCLCRFIMT
jgi:hypothetical protein